MTALDRVPFLLWVVLGCALVLGEAACRQLATAPRTDSDELDELDAALAALETGLPAARLLCLATPGEHEARACTERLDGLEAAAVQARSVLAAAQTCRQQIDQTCTAAARETARELLPRLRGGAP